jgi:hypothetical protein
MMVDAQPDPPSGPEKLLHNLLPILGSIVVICMALLPVLAIHRASGPSPAVKRSPTARVQQPPAAAPVLPPPPANDIRQEELASAAPAPPLPGTTLPATNPFADIPPAATESSVNVPEPKSPLTIRPLTRRALPGRSIIFEANKLSDGNIVDAMQRGADALLILLNQEITNGYAQRRAGVHDAHGDGRIALAVYALLTVGRITGDPRLRFSSRELSDAVFFLRSVEPNATYSVSLQASALSLLPNRPEFRKVLLRDREVLLRGNNSGFYSYETNQPPVNGDNSNTQYGQLGVWACQDAGLEVPLQYWRNVDHYWRTTQSFNGGWGYPVRHGRSSSAMVPAFGNDTFTMTAAGVASLFLAKEDIDRTVTLEPHPDKTLDLAIEWLARNF